MNEGRDFSDQTQADELDPSLAALLWYAYGHETEVETAARHLWRIHRAAQPASRKGPRRLLVGVMTALMLVASSGGALAASASSLPGDVLYPVKRGAERTRLLLAFTPERDARIWLEIAMTRLDEVERAAERRPEVIPRLVEEVNSSLARAEQSGGNAVAVEAEALREQVEGHDDAVTDAEEIPVVESEAVTAAMPDGDSTASDTIDAEPEPAPTASSEPSPSESPSPTPTPSDDPSATPSPDPSESEDPEPEPTPSEEPSEPVPGPTKGGNNSKRFEGAPPGHDKDNDDDDPSVVEEQA